MLPPGTIPFALTVTVTPIAYVTITLVTALVYRAVALVVERWTLKAAHDRGSARIIERTARTGSWKVMTGAR